jgi:hypothetical protein
MPSLPHHHDRWNGRPCGACADNAFLLQRNADQQTREMRSQSAIAAENFSPMSD